MVLKIGGITEMNNTTDSLLYSLSSAVLKWLKPKSEVDPVITFYLFTDGGGFPREDGGFNGVSAYRVYTVTEQEARLLYHEETVTEKKTSQFGEIQAIAKGLEHIQLYLDDMKIQGNVSIKIFTDSMLYFKSLTEWIYGWIKKAREGVLYNSSNQPVINQDEIKAAFGVLLAFKKKNYFIRFFHINSHISIHKLGALKQKFESFNQCEISDEEMMFIYKGNQACDDAIKIAYQRFMENKTRNNNIVESKS